jgi:SAM-dependent methyltransferase
LVLSGWAVSPVGIGAVVVQIDDRLLYASYGLETPWVAKNMPDLAGADHAGYRLELDTSDWGAGARKVRITAYDRDGARTDVVGEVDVVPFGAPKYTKEENLAAIAAGEMALRLELPSTAKPPPEVASPLQIAGWAYAPKGVDAVFVIVDGRTRYEALHPITRPDLLDDYGADVASKAGFVLRLHSRDVPPGPHRLTVVAVDGERRAVGVETSFVCRPEPSPAELPAPGAATPIEWLPGPRPSPSGSPVLERYDPERHAGLLLEAEHQLRYRLAAPLAAGRDVLDAGCGSGWGTALLAEAGAASVAGLDADEQAVESARRRTDGLAAEVQRGELAALPFDDASFDLVLCFDTIDRVADPDAALEELRRVLRADGTLLISASRRASNDRGGVHKSIPGGLERALRDRFANVRVQRQRTFLGSAVADDAKFEIGDGTTDLGIEVRKLGVERPGGEQHTLAVAGDAELPELPPTAMLAQPAAVRRLHGIAYMWQDRALLAEADAAASRNQANLARMYQEGAARQLQSTEARVRELTGALNAMRAAVERAERREAEQQEELAEQSANVERQAAEVERQAAELEQRSRDLLRLAELETALAEAEGKITAYDESLSWRLTRPLRAIRPGRRGKAGFK